MCDFLRGRRVRVLTVRVDHVEGRRVLGEADGEESA